MKVEVYDFETTGVNPRECEPVQVASMLIELQDSGAFEVLGEASFYLQIKADHIPAGAQAVHGISIEQVRAEGENPHEVIPSLSPTVLGYNNQAYDDIIAARYGADIEQSFDMFRIVKRLRNRNLLEHGKLSQVFKELTGKDPVNAHDALGDVRMTAQIIYPLMRRINADTFHEMIEKINVPFGSLRHLMPFGKYKGEMIGDLRKGYVRWALENLTDIDPDLRASLEMAA